MTVGRTAMEELVLAAWFRANVALRDRQIRSVLQVPQSCPLNACSGPDAQEPRDQAPTGNGPIFTSEVTRALR